MIVENSLCGDELRTDLGRLEGVLTEIGPSNVVCVMTTTSCFAPRTPDRYGGGGGGGGGRGIRGNPLYTC